MTTTRIAGVILAAGASSRYRAAAGADGPVTKLVAQHDGKPLVRHVAEAARDAGLSPLIVVTGHARAEVEQALDGIDSRFVHNADYASGLASSLKAGLAAAPAQSQAAIVLLGDMPLVTPALVAKLARAFEDRPGAAAVTPVYQGERGNPVLLASALFSDVMHLTGDAGARQILRGRDGVVEIVVDEAAARLDVDTPDALNILRKG